jgi:hypothetical protein
LLTSAFSLFWPISKGSGFLPFESFPHVVDVVTNLHKSGVQRMFTPSTPVARRQELNTRTKDISNIFWGFHLHGRRASLSASVRIIDEYAG